MPRRPVVADPDGALGALRRTIARFGAVLDELIDDDWERPTIGELTVRTLVGHVIGSDRYLGAQLGFWAADHDGSTDDHLDVTRSAIEAAATTTTTALIGRWAIGAGALLAGLDALSADARTGAGRYHSIEATIDGVLIARSFELWTHEEDIRRATGLPLLAPEAARSG